MKHVVIIGAGFGGIYSAKKLIGKVKLTLIDPNDFFMFTPLLHEVISGKLDKKNITIPIKDILKGIEILDVFADIFNDVLFGRVYE